MPNLSLDVLLEPISAESPAGASLRLDPVYDRIQAARREEPALSQGVWARPLRQADWAQVEELCRAALTTRSKDLQLAVWLTEAWLRLYGLPGFASGLRLIHDLHTHYLYAMLPSPEVEDGERSLPLNADHPAIERRLNLLQWLNEKLAVRLRLMPLSSPNGADAHPVSLADMEAAQYRVTALQSVGGDAATRVTKVPADGGLAASLALTATDQIAQMNRDLDGALAELEALGALLDRCYGPANGGVLHLREALEAMKRAIAPAVPVESEGRNAPEVAKADPQPAACETSGQTQQYPQEKWAAAVPVRRFQQGGFLEGRREAYAVLAQVADYLTSHEPHSPVPYLLRRAIAWGGMSFPELLPELLREQTALKDVELLLNLDRDR
jgi:type VI secretion system protein ImpA